METVTTILSPDPPRQPLPVRPAANSGGIAGRLMSGAVVAAGNYAQRAGATWLLWLRTNNKPPHDDL